MLKNLVDSLELFSRWIFFFRKICWKNFELPSLERNYDYKGAKKFNQSSISSVSLLNGWPEERLLFWPFFSDEVFDHFYDFQKFNKIILKKFWNQILMHRK